MGKTEPLTNVDAAWLGMEDPTNLMMVSGITTFDAPIDYEKLKIVIENRFLPFRRFRQCVIQPRMPLAPSYWEDDPNFDINSHLHRVALPAPGNKAMLQEMASDLMSTPLDFSKPLWHMHLIENYGDGCALMSRLHHCIADGMALMMVLLSMTDFTPDAPPFKAKPQVVEERESRGGPLTALFKQASSTAKSFRKLTRNIISEGVETITNPTHAIELALKGSDTALATSRLILRTPDPQTIFKGELGVAKRAAWSDPLRLKDVKRIRKVTGGTVNDVLVSAMTGGLRRYMLHRGQEVEGVNFRAAVPVNLRTQDEMSELGNKFGIVYLSLPIGIHDPLERLVEVNKRMTALKGSQEAPASFAILNAIGMSPRDAQDEMVKMFAAKATAVMTNVPGPPMPLYMAGSKMNGLMFWVPQSGRVSLGISILSYANKVFLGVATDAGLVPDPDVIIEGFYKEYDALMDLVREADEVVAAEAKAAAAEKVDPIPAKPDLTNAAPTEDLQSVHGIGPKFAHKLQAAGINSIASLSAQSATELAVTLNINESRAAAILNAAQNGA
ncbi:MAG: wax ester/triacylglycerol synthase family O-acyltransferase [Chloroflexi bacterium]|nr:wax ester/triacylglycerol synthase family O-acyltransferase [Chloroflexota bacterium]